LIARARHGDRDAFGVLYVRHYDAVARVCHRRLGDLHLAEDATQETFLRAWRALPNFTHEVDLSHWLRRIARNHCADLHRAAARERSVVRAEPADAETAADPAAHDVVDAIAEVVAVRTLLARLQPRDAALLVDHHAAGVPVRALAQRWHMTKGAMEVALHRARQRARRFARDEGLRSLVPTVAARRVWLTVQRINPAVRDLGAPAAVTWAQAAVIVATAGALPLAPAAPRQRPPVPAINAVSPDTDALSAVVSRGHRAAGTQTTAAARGAQGQAARRSGAEPDRRSGLVPFEPIGVGDRELRSDPAPDWEVERTYRVTEPVTGRSLADLETHKGRNRELKPVHDRACPAAEAGNPMLNCEPAHR
jgi:RNA polymerase sigma-70 factor, ECF subfamily